MKILHIVSDLGQGGAQSYVCDLARDQMQREGVEVEVLALFFKGALWPRLESLGVPADCLGMRGALDLKGILHLRRRLRISTANVVHVHAIHPAVSFLVGKLPAGKVYTEHGGRLLGGDWKARLSYKYFSKNYCCFVAISRMMATFMASINPSMAGRIRVVHNGSDLERIDCIEPVTDEAVPPAFVRASYRVGVIGRLVPQKGIATFIEVAAHVVRAMPDVCFVIVGDGPLRMELERQAEKLGLGGCMQFLGYRTDAIAILKRLDVFLFTSEFEPFGLVITEAMGAGIPVVAPHGRDAVAEIIDDGVDGFVVEGRAPTRLAEKVVALLRDESLRAEFGRRARKKVEQKFTMQGNADAIFSIYRECVVSGA